MLKLLSKVFYKFLPIFAVSKLLLTLGINALQEIMYCFWYSRLKKVVGMEKFIYLFIYLFFPE
jgi:hypothetical protein